MARESLRRSINRLLLLRVSLVAVVMSAVFATITFFNIRNQIQDSVVDLARVQSQLFNQRIITILDHPDGPDPDLLQEKLEQYSRDSGDTDHRDGRFVLGRIYDQAGKMLAGLSDDDFPGISVIKDTVDNADIKPLPAGEHRVVSARLDGAPYVGVAVPLINSRGEAAAQLIGVFAISDAAIGRGRGGVLRTVFYVIGIVLLTALVLYPIISNLMGRLAQQALKLLDANLEILQVLGGAIAKRDSDTDAHNYRVSVYSVRLAESLGFPRDQIKSLIKGALLHDVGKLGIRDDILLKPGKLDDDEYAIMKTHVDHGLEITERANWLEDSHQVVGSHHEKYDGTGYPNFLSAGQIPVTARIFAITDVFDALTSRRPYKEPMSFEETLQVLEQGRGSHFDPELLDAFFKIARDLYDTYAGNEGDEPRRHLEIMTQEYFKGAVGDLLG